jgi:hypothetical protein
MAVPGLDPGTAMTRAGGGAAARPPHPSLTGKISADSCTWLPSP